MIDTNQNKEIEFAAFVGIDWADLKHAWALQIPGHLEVERGDLDHTPQAVEAWAAELGLTHEALYRSLRRMQDDGLLMAEGNRLAIKR